MSPPVSPPPVRTPQPPAAVPDAGRIDVRTSDTGEFIALVNALFGPHRFLALGAEGLSGCVQGRQLGELIVGRLNYGTEAHVLVKQEREAWVMTRPVGADGAWDGNRFAPDELMLYAPEWCGRIDMHGRTWMHNTFMPTSRLQRHLHELLGEAPDGPLRFARRLPHGHGAARRLQAMSQLLQDEADGAMPRPAALLRSWESTFCLELLSLWPHAYSERLVRTLPARPRALRWALEAIDAHLLRCPAEPLSVADLARAAAVGVRALELAFRKHLATSPARYLRDRRLDRARADLLARSPGERLRVVDAALKWGFASPGHFARAYAQRFGQRPGGHRG